MPKNNTLRNRWRSYVLLLVITLPAGIFQAQVKPAIEIEHNVSYNQAYEQRFSFQFREIKLFLDAQISQNSTALVEYVMKDNLERNTLERAEFIQHDLPLESQLHIGQFRSPYGYFDQFTVSRSMTKTSPLRPDSLMPAFTLRSLDVGFLWISQAIPFSFSLGIVNGNGIDQLRDDNNMKDVIGHVMYDFDGFQVGLNGYLGYKNSLNPDGTVRSYSDVQVFSTGLEAMMQVSDAVIAGEALQTQYGSLKSRGAYVMMNMSLSRIIPTLRMVDRLEIYQPDVSHSSQDRYQWAHGFLYSISRGYTAKFEWVLNLDAAQRNAQQVFFELEYEL